MRAIGNGYLRRMNEGTPLTTGAGGVLSTWHLVSNDAAAAVEASNYLDDAADALNVGDIIFAALDIDGSPVLKNYIVTAISGAGAVTIAVQTAAAA